jgi:WD40 repeat protein/serine/threonine protein kinase
MADPPAEPRIRIGCPKCGAAGNVPRALAGRSVRCAKCGTSFRVPDPAQGPLPTVAEAVAAPHATIAAQAPPEGEWNVGDVLLGLYEVRAVLGQGGMGRVYRVFHRGWGVDLAVKTPLRQALEDAGGAELFEKEAETWVNLGLHPHTVSCYYVRRLDGLPRVFAEYVDGGSLADAIDATRYSTADAILDVAIQFAWGLHYAHEQGLIHRDIKPANVMLTADGLAKVTDFGLAHARLGAAGAGATGDRTTIAPGGGGGTPAYMAPEQWAGKPLTRRTDLWGWGLSVLEMFIGQRTWQVGPAALPALEEHLVAPSLLSVAMPATVADLLRRCFAPEPEGRPRTMAEAADVLVAAYATETGRPYPRVRPDAVQQRAGSLSNRAVSLLDLGRGGTDELWARALTAEPLHLEATYNHALHSWRSGRLGDDDFASRVREASRATRDTARGAELLAHALHAIGDHAHAAAAAPVASPGDVVTLGRTLKGFTEAVEALAVTPDGARVLASQGGSEVRVWLASGEAQKPMLPAELKVKAIAVSPDGRWAALAGEGGAPQLWEIAATRPTKTLARQGGTVTCLVFTPDGRHVIGGSTDRTVRVWDVGTGRIVHVFEGHGEGVTCVAVSPNGARAASGGRDGGLRVWDLAAGQPGPVMEGHRGLVSDVAFGSDASLVSGGEDRVLHAWDPASGQSRGTLAGPAAPISAVVPLPDPSRILITSLDRTVRVWDVTARTLLGVSRLDAPIAMASAARSGASVWVAVGSTVVEVRPAGAPPVVYALAQPASAVEVASQDTEFEERLAGARQSLTRGDLGRALTLLREARAIPGHERSDAVLELWDDVTAALPRRALESAWQAARLEGHLDPVVSLAVSVAGNRALSGDLAGGLRWWDLARRVEVESVAAHDATVSSVAFAADGAHAASASWDRTVRLWDGSGRLLRTLEGHGDYVNGVALAPSGRTVLSASSDQTLRLWDFASGRMLGALEGHEAPVSACAFGTDGRYAVSAGWDGVVRLWDVASRAPAGALQGHEGSVGSVAVSPTGRQAVSGGLDRTICVWDLAGRRLVRQLTGHEAEVTALAWLPDGHHLVSASRDKDVRLWDAASGRCVRTLTHGGAVLSVAALSSGNAILCGGTELALTLWRLDWEADMAAATTIVKPRARETVAMRTPAATQAWDDIRKAAPRAAAREAAVDVARRARRALPRAQVVGIAALLMAAVIGGYFVLRAPRRDLGLSRHRAEQSRQDVWVSDVARYAGECADGYEQYLERARERSVPDDVIGCLVKLQQPGIVDVYFRDMQLQDEEPPVAERKRRNAVSLMVGLGDAGVPSLCAALQSGREDTRWVAARALGFLATPAVVECLPEVLRSNDPGARAAGATALWITIGRGVLTPSRAWELAEPLASDPEAQVRRAAIPALAMFDYAHSYAALAPLENDADPQVATAARQTRAGLKSFRDLNPDLKY